MLSFVPSKDENTIALEFTGKATAEDAEKLDRAIQQKFDENGSFNIYAVILDVDSTSLAGVARGAKVDMKRWNQYGKIAVISEENWLEKMAGLTDNLPGIKAQHFPMEGMEEAWEWIRS